MRHRKLGRQFSRQTAHRRAMFRALTANLVLHERIDTTDANAKVLRRVVERLITRAIRLGKVAYTPGAELSSALTIPHAQLVIRKGYHPGLDRYSAFVEADGTTRPGLAGYLRERGIRRAFVTGLATDYCVAFTALDAAKAGFDVSVIEDACRGIDLNGSIASAWERMKAAGVHRIQSGDLA